VHAVDWLSLCIPLGFCGGDGAIRLKDGGGVFEAMDSPQGTAWSGRRTVNDAALPESSTANVQFGDVDGDGADEAALHVDCSNGGGTAAGILRYDLFIFRAVDGRLDLMNVLRSPQVEDDQLPSLPGEARLGGGLVSVPGAFYGPSDGTCCPSGEATTSWRYDGTTLVLDTVEVTKPAKP
jgi:hypothetical protein